MSESTSSTRGTAEHPAIAVPRAARQRPPGSIAATGVGRVRRVLARTAIATAMVATLLSGTAGVANAEPADYCRYAQDMAQMAINELQDATYAGNISEMRFWARVLDQAEINALSFC